MVGEVCRGFHGTSRQWGAGGAPRCHAYMSRLYVTPVGAEHSLAVLLDACSIVELDRPTQERTRVIAHAKPKLMCRAMREKMAHRRWLKSPVTGCALAVGKHR